MKYLMSVFKTTEKHLGSMNDCLHACIVKPVSAIMKIVKFVHFSCTKYHGLSHENCFFLSYVLMLSYFASGEGFDKLQMILVIYDIQTQNLRKPISTKQKK